MTTQETFKQFRDDIKAWVTNNLNAIGKFSEKASDITIDPIDGSDSTNAQEEFERLNSKTEWKLFKSVTGTTTIDYSSIVGKFTELEVRVKLKLSSVSIGIFILPIRIGMFGYYMSGYYYDSYNGSIGVYHNGTTLSLSSSWTQVKELSDAIPLTDAVVEVWYK